MALQFAIHNHVIPKYKHKFVNTNKKENINTFK
jgi:hypothetical protein